MAFELKGAYPKLLDITVTSVLQAYKADEVTLEQAGVEAVNGHRRDRSGAAHAPLKFKGIFDFSQKFGADGF